MYELKDALVIVHGRIMKNSLSDNEQNKRNSSTVDSPRARPRIGVRETDKFKYQWRRRNRKLFYVRTGVIKSLVAR